MNRGLIIFAIVAGAAALSSCSPPAAQELDAAPGLTAAPTVHMSAETRAVMERVNGARVAAPLPSASDDGAAEATATEAGAGEPAAAAAGAYYAGLVRMQVLLDRAHFSPGAIDGQDNENMRKAIAAYEQAHGLALTGEADDALLSVLEQSDGAAALSSYVVTDADVRGPFANVPRSLLAMSRLRRLAYGGAAEAIAEKFHMDEALMRALNPGVDFTRAGVEIVVANAGGDLDAPVDSIVVDKDKSAVLAYDDSGAPLAFYPATIGSPEAPTPTGEHHVVSVAFNPTYRYDPARLPSFGDRGHGAVTIRPGPNNPVGLVWIALSRRSYGIHGTPEPSLIGRTQSHGCVRLANWDAVELGRAVRPGAPVTFIEGGAVASLDEEAPG